MEQLGSHWMDFHENWHFSIFQSSFEKVQVSLKSNKNNGYQCTFFIIFRATLLRIRSISGTRYRENKTNKPARPRTQHDCHHNTKVKPEAATAVIELPIMGGETPETCWALNKRQDNKLENCCIWVVIYLNWTEKNTRYFQQFFSNIVPFMR
jgi:hypothetical protein